MGKPIHHQLLEAGTRNAPEADSADEVWKRVVRRPRSIQIAGAGAAVVVVLLEFLGVFADHAVGGVLAFALVIVIAAFLARFVEREKTAAQASREASSAAAREVELRAAAAERDRQERIVTDWNAHL
jgi:hypothetical protein